MTAERMFSIDSMNALDGLATTSREVKAKPERRTFSAEYKHRIVDEADRCTQPGEIGALLRREGLFSSHLVRWRAERAQGEQAALQPKRRGRKPDLEVHAAHKLMQLERENQRLQRKLKQAELIIETQKKLAELLGVTLPTPDEMNSPNW